MLIVYLCCLFFSLSQAAIPYLTLSGTHSQIGQAIGTTFKNRIVQYVQQYAFLNDVLVPYSQTSEGQSIVNQLLAINKAKYPNYIDELQGMAVGSGIPFMTLFLLNMRYELSYFSNSSIDTPLSCADVHVKNGNNVFVAHNEDAAPVISNTAYLLDLTIPSTNQKFFAYTYPGYLPGVAFGWNDYVSLSFNYVEASVVDIGLGRAFINRDALASTSAQDAINRVTVDNRAFGFTLNLGDFVQKTSYSIEVSPNAYALYENTQNFTHFNEYKLLNIPQVPDISSFYRQQRADMLPAPATQNDALALLGDNYNNDWPIYRNGVAPDHVSTVASVLFDLEGKNIQIWGNNPKHSQPEWFFY